MTEEATQPENSPEKGEVGRRLKQAREKAGLDRQAIADQLHLRPGIIQAIEEGQYDQVPGELFLKGYVRSYARHLGLSDDELIRLLDDELEPDRKAEEQAVREDPVEVILERKLARRKRVTRTGIAAGIVLLIVLASVFWPATTDEEEASDEEAPTTSVEEEAADEADTTTDDEVPDVEQPAEPAEPAHSDVAPIEALAEEESDANEAANGDSLVMTFSGECWVEIVNGDGDRVVAQLAQDGDEVEYTGPGPFDILIGAVSAVDTIVFNGEEVDLSAYPAQRDRIRFELAAGDVETLD